MQRALLLFHNNLRINDNALIAWAEKNRVPVCGLVITNKTSDSPQHRFYLESAQELQRAFLQMSIPFYVVEGLTERELPKWLAKNEVDFVATPSPTNSREQKVHNSLKVSRPSLNLITFYDQTLVDLERLPFPIKDLPLVFTPFKKRLQGADCFGSPRTSNIENLRAWQPLIPEGTRLIENLSPQLKTTFPFEIEAGETGSWRWMEEYFYETEAISHYKDTRNGMLRKNDSSKFSPALACGCLSARQIYFELQKYETNSGRNESTEWFLLELLWRDYFKLLSLKIGDRLFSRQGLASFEKEWHQDQELFERWCEGQTGADFIDANMLEFKYTGWMSNRGRQNVASYLAKILKIDWTWGAKHFEDHLLDSDLENNWGNWLYVAGVGTDPRDRVFNFSRQAEMYDGDGAYRNHWLSKKEL